MKKIRRTIAILFGAGVITLLAFACTDDLDVNKTYGFYLETMPVQKRITQGETAEIRCTLVREGDYSEARYYIRYFQPDGKGELRLDDGTLLSPNDLYPLEKMVFRMYYTSRSTDQQQIDVVVEDNYGQWYEVSFSFQNEAADSENNEDED